MFERRIITVHEFVRRFHHLVTRHNARFAFFLGAGCSYSSEIPLGGTLVHEHWLPLSMRFQTGEDGDVVAWAVSQGFDGYTPETAGRFYGKAIEDLFDSATLRQAEIDRIVKDKHPAFGYGVLAKLLAHPDAGSRCNLILTTNFDDLVADALYLYGNARPLVIVHEALIGFARAMRSAPLIVKLHGDHHLEPKNTERETSKLAEEVKTALRRLLADCGLIFMGYAGADRSIAEALSALTPDCLPSGVYWINDAWPNGDFGAWLESRNATWVKQRDFDETMLLLQNEFGLSMPNLGRFQGLLDQYEQTYKDLSGRLAARTGDQGIAWQEAAVQSARNLNPAWSTLVERRVTASAALEDARSGGDEDGELSALIDIGDIDRSLGNRANARMSYEQALTIAKRLVARTPENKGWQRGLSLCQSKCGDVLLAEGDRAGALAAYQESLEIDGRLAAHDPENMEWQHDLSVSYERIGDVRLAEGDRSGALSAYQSSLEIRERLTVRDPKDMKWQRELSVSHGKIGDLRLAEGDRPSALQAYQEALTIDERLAALNPENMEWQQDLSVSYERIGDVRLAEDDQQGASAAYQASFEIRERLAERDPENMEFQRELSVSHNRSGHLCLAEGDQAGAFTAFQASLAIAKRLVTRDPENMEWQRDLSVSYNDIGDVRKAQGDRPGALKAYEASLIIAEHLVARVPENTTWQRDLFVSHQRIGATLALIPDRRQDAIVAFRQALAIVEAQSAAGKWAPADAHWEAVLRRSIANLEAKPDRRPPRKRRPPTPPTPLASLPGSSG